MSMSLPRSFSQRSGQEHWAGCLPGHLPQAAVRQAAPALPHTLVCGTAEIESCLKMVLGHNSSHTSAEEVVRVQVFSEGWVEAFASGPSTLKASSVSWSRLSELPGKLLWNPGVSLFDSLCLCSFSFRR